MLVDSGAMENVIHEYEYKRLSGVTLDVTEDPLWAYGKEQPLNVLGKFEAKLEVLNGSSCTAIITVLRSKRPMV